jgi:hypothetical protein
MRKPSGVTPGRLFSGPARLKPATLRPAAQILSAAAKPCVNPNAPAIARGSFVVNAAANAGESALIAAFALQQYFFQKHDHSCSTSGMNSGSGDMRSNKRDGKTRNIQNKCPKK